MFGRQSEKPLTIRDISRLSNMSIGTVSRVINNSGAVSHASRKKVEEVIRRTDFQPNTAARSMVSKKSEIVGILVPEISNPFLASLVEFLEVALAGNGLSIMLCNTGYRYENISHFLNNLVRRNADGVFFVASDLLDEEHIERIRQKLNVVLINSAFGGFDSVNVTDWQSSFKMTEYLIAMGHARIACMGYNNASITTMNRYQGYCDAMKKHGLPLEEQLQRPSDSVSGGVRNRGYILTKELLELNEPPTAIFAINDYYAINAYFAAKEKGLQVGRDISIVGFDDVNIAQLVNPALTTVRCSLETMTELATDLMMKKIRGEASAGPKAIQLTGELVKRDSVAKL